MSASLPLPLCPNIRIQWRFKISRRTGRTRRFGAEPQKLNFAYMTANVASNFVPIFKYYSFLAASFPNSSDGHSPWICQSKIQLHRFAVYLHRKLTAVDRQCRPETKSRNAMAIVRRPRVDISSTAWVNTVRTSSVSGLIEPSSLSSHLHLRRVYRHRSNTFTRYNMVVSRDYCPTVMYPTKVFPVFCLTPKI